MIAKLHNSDQLSNSTLRIAHKLEKTEFQKFYQGFQHFWQIDVQPDYILFFLPSCNLVRGAMLEAEKRIDEMGLDLVVEETSHFAKTFIVRRK